ncbi:cyclic GMP-AMP synthase, partial [Cyclopterus lumpus]|uniref:cyclic GMP-AMP synthase n=1 Tax=Cyclopterus lumpus TaxID=8103 RepID=UPI0014871EC0
MKTTKVKPRGAKAKSPMDSILHTTLQRLKIRKVERSAAEEVVNRILKTIMDHLKENSQSFREVEPWLGIESYYENVKISNPDEFDVMLPVPVKQVDVHPFGGDGALYSTLSANRVLQKFRDEVEKYIKQCTGGAGAGAGAGAG